MYCEDFRDGRAFAETARTAGKPVVLLTVGRTAAAVRAAHSHTGSLTSDLDAVDAACRAAGVHRVDTPRQLVDAVQALLAAERPRGRRVGVVGDGGGYGAVASDLLGLHGLDLPVLSEATQSVLRTSLPPTAATANPVDLAGAGRAGHLQLRPRDPHPAGGRRPRRGALHGVLRRLQRALRRSARTRARGGGRARARGARDGTAARRAHDVLGLSPGPGAPRRGHPRLPGRRVRGRGPRSARGRRRRAIPRRFRRCPRPQPPVDERGLLGRAGGTRSRRRAVRRGAGGARPRRRPRRRRRARVSGCPEGARSAPQVRCGGRRARPPERGRAGQRRSSGWRQARTRSRRPRTPRPVSSCSWVRAATLASGRSSSSPRAAPTRSSSATPQSRLRRWIARAPRCCSARSPARRSSPERAGARSSTWPRPLLPWRRCRGSRLRTRRSPRSR